MQYYITFTQLIVQCLTKLVSDKNESNYVAFVSHFIYIDNCTFSTVVNYGFAAPELQGLQSYPFFILQGDV
jgi:hypothetical protein